MDLEADTVIRAVEQALAMSAVGRERWCMDWAKWLWAQEIERAVYQAKQDRSIPALRPTQTLSREPSPSRAGLTAQRSIEGSPQGGHCSACGRFTRERVNRRQRGSSGGDGNERA